MFKLIFLSSLFGACLCSPSVIGRKKTSTQFSSGPSIEKQLSSFQSGSDDQHAVILRDDREGPINGHYSFAFETSNGIVREERGTPTGPNGTVQSQGSWSHTFPDGTVAHFSFVADENGYRVESPLLPVPPPIPPHSLAQIARAQREGKVPGFPFTDRGLQLGFDDHFQASFQNRPRPSSQIDPRAFRG